MLRLDNAEVLVTMDAANREIRGGAILIDGPQIVCVGSAIEVDAWLAQHQPAAQVTRIDVSGCVVMPGLVNGHHHLFQTLTRTLGTGSGLVLFDWLKKLYPVWAGLDPEAVRVSATLGLCELLLSGATTVADHLYIYPNGVRIDDEIEAARALGVRFHPTRGSMSVGVSQGGLPPDDLVENEDFILSESQRAIEGFHDAARFSMVRVGLAPCSPFSVSAALMRQSAELARSFTRVGLHTHLAETVDEEAYCIAHFGQRPLEYAESLGWLGKDVWFAHMVHPSHAEIGQLAQSCSGVCHCATSNMILASGIAPVRAMVEAGVRVGLGVDGSASNDGNHMLGEARQAMLLQRVGWPGHESRADMFSARDALALATRGGAAMLARDDIGVLAAGMAADVVAFRVDGIEHAGAMSDPVTALLTCAPVRAWLSVINGRVVVEQGHIQGIELAPLIERHNHISKRMRQRAGV